MTVSASKVILNLGINSTLTNTSFIRPNVVMVLQSMEASGIIQALFMVCFHIYLGPGWTKADVVMLECPVVLYQSSKLQKGAAKKRKKKKREKKN